MLTWLEFVAVVAFVAAVGWLFWNDVGDWHACPRFEPVLRELASSDDLADSA